MDYQEPSVAKRGRFGDSIPAFRRWSATIHAPGWNEDNIGRLAANSEADLKRDQIASAVNEAASGLKPGETATVVLHKRTRTNTRRDDSRFIWRDQDGRVYVQR
jgi:hypothetical protein